jgi:hypothetical protein
MNDNTLYEYINGKLMTLGMEEPVEYAAVPAEWAAEHHIRLSADVRRTRDSLPRDSGVRILRALEIGPDIPDLRSHRQGLRDVPAQTGFPHKVDWPALPQNEANHKQR